MNWRADFHVALPQADREARVPVHSTHFQGCDSGFAAPDHPHLQKMLELFTAQWAGFLAKEKKVHTLANTPQATILAIIHETCCWSAVMLLTAMQYLRGREGQNQ